MEEKEEVKIENVDSTDNQNKDIKKPWTFKRIINLIIDCVLQAFFIKDLFFNYFLKSGLNIINFIKIMRICNVFT